MRNVKTWFSLLVLLFTLAACVRPPIAIPLQITDTPTIEKTPTQLVEPADIIFHNGTIITIEKSQPTAEALAIRGQLIQAVGTEEEILAYQGTDTLLVDLQGHTLMPGFEDGHTHYTRNKWGEGVPLETLMDDLLAFGLTSIAEMHSTDEYIDFMLDAEKNNEIDVRLNIFGEYNCGFLENGKSLYCPSWYPDNPPILDPTHMVRIPGVKIFLDGAGGNRGCPYMSFKWPDNIADHWPDIWETCSYPYGDLYLTEDELTAVLQDIQDRGYRASLHVMGDAGLDVALNAIEKVLNGQSNLIYRHQIQHSSTLRPDQIDRYVQLNILAQVPGYFNTCEAEELEAMYPEDYYTWDTTRFALPGLGVHTYYGGDCSGRVDIHKVGSALNPIWGLYGLVTRKQFREDMTICEPPEWVAKYKISVEQALEMVTIEPAYAVSMEDYIGSVRPGKFADLIILSDNPLTMNPDDLYKLTVWMTMVNGTMKYCAPGKEAYCPSANQVKAAETVSPTDFPQMTQIKMNCDKRGESPILLSSEDFVQTYVKWEAKTTDQLNEFMASERHSIFVNGEQVNSNISHGEIEKTEGVDAVFVKSMFDVGILKPGEYEIRTILTFDHKITDGFDWYGPGTQYPTIEGTCTVIIE